jgi:hypothetical protein
MPALFAYLIAVGLLLGGGYGAVSWLAAPEPVKLAAKHKAKQVPPSPSHDEAASETSISKADAPVIAESAALNSRAQSPTPRSEANRKENEQSTASVKIEPVQEPIQEPKNLAVKAEAEPPAQATSAIPPGNSQSAASAAPPRVTKATTRPSGKPAVSHPKKPALAVMTLRTIEFPDGRRLTQLIPYRSNGRAMAFEADE